MTATTADSPPVLRLRHLSKQFGGTRALDDVALEVAGGVVHGLLGHNGSGKSTLIRILAGYYAPEPGGELELGGMKVRLPLRPGQFRELGMAFVHQDPALLPALTVTENLRIGAFARGMFGRVSWRQQAASVGVLLAEFGIDCDPLARVEQLRPWQRPLLAIVRAVDEVRRLTAPGGSVRGSNVAATTAAGPARCGLLVLDEPTAGLGDASVERLFALIERVKLAGFGVLFVSHDLDEVLTITDQVTVLRDGRVAGGGRTSALGKDALVEMIVGRRIERRAPAASASADGPKLAAIRDLRGPGVRDASFNVARGEILGMTGLIGSGFAEVGALLAGALPARTGTLRIAQTELPVAAALDIPGLTARRAIAAGIAYVPADRLRTGCVGELTVAENIGLPVLDRLTRGGMLAPHALAEHAGALCRRFDVRPPDPSLRFDALSGGNQQKALLAKWLQLSPRLLVLEEPTQGVDVGAREQIFAAIRAWAADGAGVLCLSSDHEQLAMLCQRVLIFRRGRISAELAGADVTEERMAHECFGQAAGPSV
jgi:ribose transport system ATP-binding protein